MFGQLPAGTRDLGEDTLSTSHEGQFSPSKAKSQEITVRRVSIQNQQQKGNILVVRSCCVGLSRSQIPPEPSWAARIPGVGGDLACAAPGSKLSLWDFPGQHQGAAQCIFVQKNFFFSVERIENLEAEDRGRSPRRGLGKGSVFPRMWCAFTSSSSPTTSGTGDTITLLAWWGPGVVSAAHVAPVPVDLA